MPYAKKHRNEKQKESYHKKRYKYHQLRYLVKKNEIAPEELEGLETMDEKLEYARLVHIRNKFGITVRDIADDETVVSLG